MIIASGPLGGALVTDIAATTATLPPKRVAQIATATSPRDLARILARPRHDLGLAHAPVAVDRRALGIHAPEVAATVGQSQSGTKFDDGIVAAEAPVEIATQPHQ